MRLRERVGHFLLGRQEGDLRTRNIWGHSIATVLPDTLTPLAGSSATAVAANPETAMAVPAVYRAVAMIAGSVATMPWASWWPDRNVLVDRQPSILRQPDPFQPTAETLRQLASAMLLYGEAFAWLTAPNSDGYPTSAIPLDNREVSVEWNEARTRARYFWRKQELFQYRTILHLKYFTTPGTLHGLGPIQMARQSVYGGILSDKMATDYYTSGGIVDGVLEAPNKMTSTEADRLAKTWQAGQGGKRGVPVLEGGMTFRQTTMNNADAQFIEGRNFTVQDIGRLFGIPAPLLNASMPGSSLQYRNQEGIATEYATFAVQPVTEVLEAGFGMLIPHTQQVRFNFTQLLRSDSRTRYEVYTSGIAAGILTVNEVRRLEGLAPVPGGGDIPETGEIDEGGGEAQQPVPAQVDVVEVE